MSVSVLVCDDSLMARKQILRVLPEGWAEHTTTATNGKEGLDAIRAGLGQIVFLDLTMPELDGFGVLEAIKREAISAKIIVISADIQPEAKERVMKLGALAFIRKPVDADRLNETLKAHGLL